MHRQAEMLFDVQRQLGWRVANIRQILLRCIQEGKKIIFVWNDLRTMTEIIDEGIKCWQSLQLRSGKRGGGLHGREISSENMWSSKLKDVFSSPLNLTEIYFSFMHGTVSVKSLFFSPPFLLPKLKSHNKDRSKKKSCSKCFANGKT